MKNKLFVLLPFIFVLSLVSTSSHAQNPAAEHWPQWRGPLATGAAIKGHPPVQFGESKNLKWKTAIPGKGHATPMVWGDKIILQTAVATSQVSPDAPQGTEGGSRMAPNQTDKVHDFKVLLVDRGNGKILWEKTVANEWPQESTHDLGSWASNSPCTDGEFIYA